MNAGKLVHQRGVGLVEVLIAVLVLSIGLLGLAGLQLRTLRNNQSSLERGIAVVQTHFIVDAMRADRANAIEVATRYNITLAAPNPTGTLFRQVAVRRWRENITAALGTGATGQIDCNGRLCTIIVQWNDQRGTQGSVAEAAAAATYQVTTTVQL